MDEQKTMQSSKNLRLSIAGVILLVGAYLFGVVQIIDTKSDLDQAERRIRRLQTDMSFVTGVANEAKQDLESLAIEVSGLDGFSRRKITNLEQLFTDIDSSLYWIERNIEALEDFAYEVSDYLG